MIERLLLPPEIHEIDEEATLDFLWGPVQGAPDWQTPAAQVMLNVRPDLLIASPRKDYSPGEFSWDKQVSWEKHHLCRAALNGVLIGWFAAQDHSLPYEEGRPYAQTSRIEFGRIAGWMDYDDSIHLVLGIDPQYSSNGGGNERYLRHTASEHDVYVHDNTEDLLDQALSLA